MGRGRLSGRDLARPFPGIRVRAPASPENGTTEDSYELQRLARVEAAAVYAHRMPVNQHISHESAAALWGAPLPLAFT